MNIRITIPEDVKTLLDRLRGSGYEAFTVGGCVRDTLMGRVPNDWDIATSALPEETKKVFRSFRTVETGLKHGTLTVLVHGAPYEITTYRVDGEYTDHRRPDSVVFVRDLSEDLARRDFTVNAMAADEDGLRDLYGGQNDIALRVVRCVGEPAERFREDALRILRAARFASVLDFTIDPATRDAMSRLKYTLENVSRERVYVELKKLLNGRGAPRILRECRDVLQCVMPLADAGLTDRLALLDDDPILRLAFLLRPLGPDAARDVMKELKSDNASSARVCAVAREPAGALPASLPDALRLLNRAEKQGARDVLACERALGNPAADDAALLIATAADGCYTIRQLSVTGSDLAQNGIPAGPVMGRILGELLRNVMDGETANEKSALLSLALRLAREQ